MVDLGSLVIMWCYVMLHWNHSAEAASRALPSRVHAQPDSTRLTRLEIVSSEVEQSHRSGLMTSDDFWWLLSAKGSSKVAAAVTVTYCHILSHIVTFSWPPYYLSPLYASTPSTFFFWGCWNSFRMDHKECRTTRPPGSAHAMPSMISGRDKVLVEKS